MDNFITCKHYRLLLGRLSWTSWMWKISLYIGWYYHFIQSTLHIIYWRNARWFRVYVLLSP